MNDKQYTKCFYEEKTDTIYKTIKAAKEAIKHHCIYRCWMINGEIKAVAQLCYHGEPVRTIKSADDKISDAIEKGTVGKGTINKLLVC